MAQDFTKIVTTTVDNHEQGVKLLDRLLAAAKPESAFSAPVTQGEYTVITAAETSAGVGFAYGMGGGSGPAPTGSTNGDGAAETQEASGGGGGGGGGGSSLSRPVAAIVMGPDGVRLEYIVDPTKISVSLFGGIFKVLALALTRRGRGRARKGEPSIKASGAFGGHVFVFPGKDLQKIKASELKKDLGAMVK